MLWDTILTNETRLRGSGKLFVFLLIKGEIVPFKTRGIVDSRVKLEVDNQASDNPTQDVKAETF